MDNITSDNAIIKINSAAVVVYYCCCEGTNAAFFIINISTTYYINITKPTNRQCPSFTMLVKREEREIKEGIINTIQVWSPNLRKSFSGHMSNMLEILRK